jgi:hypothetical protein
LCFLLGKPIIKAASFGIVNKNAQVTTVGLNLNKKSLFLNKCPDKQVQILGVSETLSLQKSGFFFTFVTDFVIGIRNFFYINFLNLKLGMGSRFWRVQNFFFYNFAAMHEDSNTYLFLSYATQVKNAIFFSYLLSSGYKKKFTFRVFSVNFGIFKNARVVVFNAGGGVYWANLHSNHVPVFGQHRLLTSYYSYILNDGFSSFNQKNKGNAAVKMFNNNNLEPLDISAIRADIFNYYQQVIDNNYVLNIFSFNSDIFNGNLLSMGQLQNCVFGLTDLSLQHQLAIQNFLKFAIIKL